MLVGCVCSGRLLLRLQRLTILDRSAAREAQYAAAQRRNAAHFQAGEHANRTAQTGAQQCARHRIHRLLVGQRLAQLSLALLHRNFALLDVVGNARHLFALLDDAAVQTLKDAVQVLQIAVQMLQLIQANRLLVQLMGGQIEIALDGGQLALLLLLVLLFVVVRIVIIIVGV